MPPETGKPLRRDAQRNRERILAAAREVFAERGVAATLDDVAARAGVGVGTVYRRFRNKDVLLDELFEARIDELAAFAGEAQRRGRDLLFVIGGDEGLDESVRKAAKKVVSLSRMVLPHRLARLVLVEQIYRAFTIVKGEPYHK
jgi:23S rRNA (pseudouridine1915-N3)-methyltransferase